MGLTNLVLGGEAIDDLAGIAEHFDVEKLREDVEIGLLADWLDEGGDEVRAARVRGMDTGGEDFAERLIAALWPEEGAEERATARRKMAEAAARAKAEEEERARQEKERLAAAVAAEEERTKKIAEAWKQAEREETRPVEEVLCEEAWKEAVRQGAPNATEFEIEYVSRLFGKWKLHLVFLDRHRKVVGRGVILIGEIQGFGIHFRGRSFKLREVGPSPVCSRSTVERQLRIRMQQEAALHWDEEPKCFKVKSIRFDGEGNWVLFGLELLDKNMSRVGGEVSVMESAESVDFDEIWEGRLIELEK